MNIWIPIALSTGGRLIIDFPNGQSWGFECNIREVMVNVSDIIFEKVSVLPVAKQREWLWPIVAHIYWRDLNEVHGKPGVGFEAALQNLEEALCEDAAEEMREQDIV